MKYHDAEKYRAIVEGKEKKVLNLHQDLDQTDSTVFTLNPTTGEIEAWNMYLPSLARQEGLIRWRNSDFWDLWRDDCHRLIHSVSDTVLKLSLAPADPNDPNNLPGISSSVAARKLRVPRSQIDEYLASVGCLSSAKVPGCEGRYVQHQINILARNKD